MLRLNDRADSSSYIILWGGTLIAVLIITTWYFQNFYNVSNELDLINDDLKIIRDSLNIACQSVYYRTEINPKNEKGLFEINDHTICINTTKIEKCVQLFCNTSFSKKIDLAEIVTITIEKKES